MGLRQSIRKPKNRIETAPNGVLPCRDEMPERDEPDLLRHMQLIELLGRSVTPGAFTVVPEEVKVYADRVWLQLSVCKDQNLTPVEIICPYEAGARYASFEVEGLPLRWDLEDGVLRYDPTFDPAVRADLNPWLSILDSRVIRVEREYALHNLSEACLAYAFRDNGDSFYWCIQDHSCMPVVFELNPVFWEAYHVLSETILSPHVQDLYSLLSAYSSSYCNVIGLTTDNFIDICLAQKNRSPWEPKNQKERTN